MFDIGWSELAVVAVVALVVIGPKDLPRVLRSVGQWVAKARAVARDVKVFSATCTHLGCQVLWDREAKNFKCPCHGGVYAATGEVLEGPPPRPLDVIEAKVEGADDSVLVRV